MAAAETLTWDIEAADGGPRRPSLEDVGGATIEDEAPYPDKATMPYADQLNQLQLQVAALGKVVGAVVVSIRFPGGAPVLDSFSAAGTNIVSGTFTVTDNGTGDTSVTWPANTVPTPVAKPQVSFNELGDFRGVVAPITNGFRVQSFNAAGAAANVAFTVEYK